MEDPEGRVSLSGDCSRQRPHVKLAPNLRISAGKEDKERK